jgi:hypothetical protein
MFQVKKGFKFLNFKSKCVFLSSKISSIVCFFRCGSTASAMVYESKKFVLKNFAGYIRNFGKMSYKFVKTLQQFGKVSYPSYSELCMAAAIAEATAATIAEATAAACNVGYLAF